MQEFLQFLEDKVQLSKFTDYSIKVLIYLATLEKKKLTCITEVSEVYQISRNHLVKVIHNLGQLGLIETIRGKSGGFRLNADPKTIKVGSIIRTIEPLSILNCSPKACNISELCRLSKYLTDAKEKFIEELDQYTIHDLVRNHEELPLFFQKRRQKLTQNNG